MIAFTMKLDIMFNYHINNFGYTLVILISYMIPLVNITKCLNIVYIDID